MLDISNNGIIRLTRGDSMKVPLFINNGTDMSPIRYTLNSNDTVYFAIMEPNRPFEDAILKKVLTAEDEMTDQGDLWIKLDPADTEHLLPGKYFYTVKLKTITDDGKYTVRTVITEKEFWLTR